MSTEASSMTEIARRIHHRIYETAEASVERALRDTRDIPERIAQALETVCGPQVRCTVNAIYADALADIRRAAVADARKRLIDQMLDGMTGGEVCK